MPCGRSSPVSTTVVESATPSWFPSTRRVIELRPGVLTYTLPSGATIIARAFCTAAYRVTVKPAGTVSLPSYVVARAGTRRLGVVSIDALGPDCASAPFALQATVATTVSVSNNARI